ncbi:hypothetical protein FGO68_gene14014 [Halteria grandinella]|uniref:Uncharacterized protein n=1 Tax=Halteria grandinella TaxID=5974 RepID=A0A8J8P5L5_HALGN|nr:hypothetical protein FGO68_gene14014 [Halteria grandinella]
MNKNTYGAHLQATPTIQIHKNQATRMKTHSPMCPHGSLNMMNAPYGSGIPQNNMQWGSRIDSSPAGFRINYFHAIKDARSGSNRSGQQLVLGGFGNEAEKAQVQRNNSGIKSKFFRLSRYSQSKKGLLSKCEEVKIDKIDESQSRKSQQDSSEIEQEDSDEEDEEMKRASNDLHLGLPQRPNRKEDRASRKKRWSRQRGSRVERQRTKKKKELEEQERSRKEMEEQQNEDEDPQQPGGFDNLVPRDGRVVIMDRIIEDGEEQDEVLIDNQEIDIQAHVSQIHGFKPKSLHTTFEQQQQQPNSNAGGAEEQKEQPPTQQVNLQRPAPAALKVLQAVGFGPPSFNPAEDILKRDVSGYCGVPKEATFRGSFQHSATQTGEIHYDVNESKRNALVNLTRNIPTIKQMSRRNVPQVKRIIVD